MAGAGALYVLWGAANGLRDLSSTLHESMVEEIFRIYPSYVPLFAGASFAAGSGEKLQRSLAPVGGFLRESVEDGGVLWGLRAPSDLVLAAVGARRTDEGWAAD